MATAAHGEHGPELSVVVPLGPRYEDLEELCLGLRRVLHPNATGDYEVVFVDDATDAQTGTKARAVAERCPEVRVIRLQRRMGEATALAIGAQAARGEILVTLDPYLHVAIEELPRLLTPLRGGMDLVCGWRFPRRETGISRAASNLFNGMARWLTGVPVHDYGCSLKAYRAASIKRTPLYAQFHRFIPALATLTGALIAEVKVAHHPRRFGKTKYTLARTWRVALDMITVAMLLKFASKPLRFFGVLALLSLGAAAVCVARAWDSYVGPSHTVMQVLPGIAMLSAWLAGHLLIVGLVAELCLVTAHARPEALVAAE